MTSTREIFNVADRSEFAVSAIDALKVLLAHAHYSGDDLSQYENGITLLFEPHIETLHEASRALRAYVFAESEAVAAASSEEEKVRGLRRELIAGAMGYGAQAGEIAAALNMGRPSVDRVIAQLKGEVRGEAEPTPERMAG